MEALDTDRQQLSTPEVCVHKLETKLETSCALSTDLADVMRERDRYNIILQSLTVQVQGLLAGFDDIVACAQGVQASITEGTDLLLKEIHNAISGHKFVVGQ